MGKNCFTYFKASTENIELPKRFTFPFYYEPHPLSVLAAKELQEHLETQTDWEHNFGINEETEGLRIGKMFGVLVVKNKKGELGYLSAFSGKLAESNHHPKFVPPVFDMLTEDSFFNQGMKILNPMNRQIEVLEAESAFLKSKKTLKEVKEKATETIQTAKTAAKIAKKERKAKRVEAKKILDAAAYEALNVELSKESTRSNYVIKDMNRYWSERVSEQEAELKVFTDEIDALKQKRKEISASLQQQLFDQYTFLNQAGEHKSLGAIFVDVPPIAGAGECAAPKLLQYAFLNELELISMAEFWWGKSPKSAIRKHQQYYPACRGKCKPILGHMLNGVETDDNPMLVNTAMGQEISTVYEDEYMLVINKPAEFLSVPGKIIEDSVQFRMQLKYPDATGPMVVHRLDMSTSGLMIIAKSIESYKFLQQQFIKRKVKKRYVALLEDLVEKDEGLINLPLRVDLEDRPRQLVCYDYGKNSQTKWKVIDRKNGQTRMHFFPITGRTHQLRVHSAHPLGLNIPIIGDDLYGNKGDRLHLHAEFIEFMHPVSKEMMQIEVAAEF
ncbi:MAG: RluA family pseudouridine synthase [Saprospiraceae bacterium]